MTVTDAARRFWPLIALFTVVGAGAGVGVGLAKSPTFEAQAQLVVGQATLQTQSLPGYVQGAQDLASAYSRIARSPQLVEQAARTLGSPPAAIASSIDAAPIPASPVFRITTKGASASDALALNRAVVDATVRYIRVQIGSSDDSADRAYRTFVTASSRAAQFGVSADRLESQLRRNVNGVSSRRVATERAKQAQQQLLADTAAQQFQNARTTATPTSKGASVIAQPIAASSDRSSLVQKLAFAGVIAGGFVGLAAALLLSERRRRREAL